MAKKNITINVKTIDGYDNLYPETYADIVNYDETKTVKGKIDEIDSNITTLNNGKENKATYVSYTMPVWTSATFTNLETTYPSSNYNLEIQLSNSCTSTQIDAWNDAQILGSITNNNLYSKGDYPTISIPTYIKIVEVD